MRIVQVIGVVAPRYGGPSIGAVELNRALNRAGCKARLISTTRDGSIELPREAVRTLASEGADLQLYPTWGPPFLQWGRGMMTGLLRAARGADVLHMHGQFLPIHVATYLAARLTGTPYGIQLHGSLEPFQRRFSRGRKRLYNLIVGNRILAQASYIQFASASEARNAADVVRAAQVSIVPLGASLPAAERPTGAAQLSTGSRIRVLFLGRLAKKKQPDMLLRAWARRNRATDAELVIIGPSGEWTTGELDELAASLGIADSVQILGPRSGSEKSWWYESATIFVLPSVNENFGVALAEAMLAACAIITTSSVAASEHVEAAGAGWILDSPGVEELAVAIDEALADPDELGRMGMRARRYAEQHLSWDATAGALVKRIEADRVRRVP